jgi:hypothetical protein
MCISQRNKVSYSLIPFAGLDETLLAPAVCIVLMRRAFFNGGGDSVYPGHGGREAVTGDGILGSG